MIVNMGQKSGQTHLIVKLECLGSVHALRADQAHSLKLTLKDNITTRNSNYKELQSNVQAILAMLCAACAYRYAYTRDALAVKGLIT